MAHKSNLHYNTGAPGIASCTRQQPLWCLNPPSTLCQLPRIWALTHKSQYCIVGEICSDVKLLFWFMIDNRLRYVEKNLDQDNMIGWLMAHRAGRALEIKQKRLRGPCCTSIAVESGCGGRGGTNSSRDLEEELNVWIAKGSSSHMRRPLGTPKQRESLA